MNDREDQNNQDDEGGLLFDYEKGPKIDLPPGVDWPSRTIKDNKKLEEASQQYYTSLETNTINRDKDRELSRDELKEQAKQIDNEFEVNKLKIEEASRQFNLEMNYREQSLEGV